MRLNTFFQICVYIMLCMLILTLCVNFVSAANFFGPAEIQAGPNLGDSANETFTELTDEGINTTDMWSIVLVGASAAGILIAAITRSTAIIGVFMFSAVFWASYINMFWTISIFNYVPIGLLSIAHAGMLFIYVGAVVGMLSGSG